MGFVIYTEKLIDTLSRTTGYTKNVDVLDSPKQ